MKRYIYYITILISFFFVTSCSHSKKFAKNYYNENETTLLSIRDRFKVLFDKNPFSLELIDKDVTRISMEIHTDSIKYIYTFRTDEPFLIDTLRKYHFDLEGMSELIMNMQKARCTWITNLDYYEKLEKKYLLFISVRDKNLNGFLRSEKYFTLAFFDQPQPYDEKGRLLDREDLKKNRLINDGIFRRVRDNVCYALTSKYR